MRGKEDEGRKVGRRRKVGKKEGRTRYSKGTKEGGRNERTDEKVVQ
jgi:hypothetical protein